MGSSLDWWGIADWRKRGFWSIQGQRAQKHAESFVLAQPAAKRFKRTENATAIILPKNLLAGRNAFRWNHEPEGGPLLHEDELAQWWTDVHELSPVLRDYYLVCLFTGARAMEVARMSWADVDLERGLVHFPEPKGGAKKAYTIQVQL